MEILNLFTNIRITTCVCDLFKRKLFIIVGINKKGTVFEFVEFYKIKTCILSYFHGVFFKSVICDDFHANKVRLIKEPRERIQFFWTTTKDKLGELSWWLLIGHVPITTKILTVNDILSIYYLRPVIPLKISKLKCLRLTPCLGFNQNIIALIGFREWKPTKWSSAKWEDQSSNWFEVIDWNLLIE